MSSFKGEQLKSIIERIERLEEEKAIMSLDIKDVYLEAKANGYDIPVLKKIIAIRKQDRNYILEFESVLEVYKTALGMQ